MRSRIEMENSVHQEISADIKLRVFQRYSFGFFRGALRALENLGAVGILSRDRFHCLKRRPFACGNGLDVTGGAVEAHFHRTNGLQVGAPVALSGVTIGAADSIDFPSDPRADFINVRMWMEKRAAERIAADSDRQHSYDWPARRQVRRDNSGNFVHPAGAWNRFGFTVSDRLRRSVGQNRHR